MPKWSAATSPRPHENPGMWAGHLYETGQGETGLCPRDNKGKPSLVGYDKGRPSLKGGVVVLPIPQAPRKKCGSDNSRSAPSLTASQVSNAKHSSSEQSKTSKQSSKHGTSTKKSLQDLCKKSVSSLGSGERSSPRLRSNASMSTASGPGSERSPRNQTQLNNAARLKYCGSDVSLASYRNAGTEMKRVINPPKEFSGDFTPRDAVNLERDMFYRSIREMRPMSVKDEKPRPKPMSARQARYEDHISSYNYYDYSPRPIIGYGSDAMKAEYKASHNQGFGGSTLEMYACPPSRTETNHPHMSEYGGYYTRANYGGYWHRQRLHGGKKSFHKDMPGRGS